MLSRRNFSLIPTIREFFRRCNFGSYSRSTIFSCIIDTIVKLTLVGNARAIKFPFGGHLATVPLPQANENSSAAWMKTSGIIVEITRNEAGGGGDRFDARRERKDIERIFGECGEHERG